MKKISILLGGLILVFSGLIFRQENSYSEDALTYAAECGTDECCNAYHEGMEALEQDWSQNLSTLIDQEKPASQMVEESFENLRTYNCWLEYLCQAVLYSGVAEAESVRGTGITSSHIQVLPGCQAPESLTFENTWQQFSQNLDKNTNLGEGIIKPNRLNFIPQCQTSGDKNRNPLIYEAERNYQGCLNTLEQKLGCPADNPNCGAESSNFAALEGALKAANADQKARTLETKLNQIVSGMSLMHQNAEELKTRLNALEQRYDCRPGKCS